MQQPPPPRPHVLAPAPHQIPPPTAAITTEVIQKHLDENKQLILAILDNQNLEKLAECAQYQVMLQKNLLYLAEIADAQPQISAALPQVHPDMAVQQGVQFMQQPQDQILSLRPTPPFNTQQMPQKLPRHQLYPQQGLTQNMGARPAVDNGLHTMSTEAAFGGANASVPSSQGPPVLSKAGGPISSLDARRNAQNTTAVSASENAALGDNRNSTPEQKVTSPKIPSLCM